jgi:hypothetical protein
VTVAQNGKKPKQAKEHGRKATEVVPTPVVAPTVTATAPVPAQGKKPKKEKHGKPVAVVVAPAAPTAVEPAPVEQPQIAATVPLVEPAVTVVDDSHDNGHGHAYGREKHGDK